MIVSVLHQKGGTGKSTLAVALAIFLASRGETVALLDADPQGTVTQWGRRYAASFKVEVKPQRMRGIPEAVEVLRNIYDHIIIDTPPSVNADTEPAIIAADVLLSPMRPALSDLWALDRLAAMVLLAECEKKPPHVLVLNMCMSPDEREDMAAKLRGRPIKLSTVQIPLSPAWTATFEGTPPDGEMLKILSDLWQELEVAIGIA